MNSRPFFSRRIPFFGNYAMVVMCLVFFTLPFIIRGARQAVENIENKVADWLPSDFPETTELRWFREHFVGDQFVVISWDGCYENDSTFKSLVSKLRAESVEEQEKQWAVLTDLPPTERHKLRERIDARIQADELKLHTTGNYHEDWSANNVKWLVGEKNQWYFINRKGELWKWKGQNNVLFQAGLAIQSYFNQPVPQGKHIATYGDPTNNEYYKDPSKLHCRFFKNVTTGPEIFAQMAGENGTMRMGDWGEDDKATLDVQIEAHKRLTGLLFGPTPRQEFDWTWRSLKNVIPENHEQNLPDSDEEIFVAYVEDIVKEHYDNDFNALLNAPQDEKLEYWYRLWNRLSLDAPPRQTCIIVSLNEPVLTELFRAVGRPVLGKPRGRILELASGHCGIEPENLHIGGPPVDNVAIDEEGAITLFRLVGLSAFIGITLAWISFRSIRITLMLFFTGGTAAMTSLAIVFFVGETMDAILMTMPSLVYVLGLSGAVHVVNYYRDACEENGQAGAAETAVRHGWFPCTLAAFTTALGLISLYTSNLTPIKKFGLFSALAALATVILLFSYLPAALTIWPSGYDKKKTNSQNRGFSLADKVSKFWRGVCERVIVHNKLVTVVSIVLLVFFAVGVTKIQTSIQLLKLFRSDAKILNDYRWMEDNMGKLVPMELIIGVDDGLLRHQISHNVMGEQINDLTDPQLLEYQSRLSMLQRMELSNRIRTHLLKVFGDEGLEIVGSAMSSDVAVDIDKLVTRQERGNIARDVLDSNLLESRDQLMDNDYVRLERVNIDGKLIKDKEPKNELWRISLRLAALNDVDYGEFVNELKTVVEPIMASYRYRNQVIRAMQASLGSESLTKGNLLVLGPNPKEFVQPDFKKLKSSGKPLTSSDLVDQTYLFADNFYDLLLNAGYLPKKEKQLFWLDPSTFTNLPPDSSNTASNDKPLPYIAEDKFAKSVANYDCVILIDDDPKFDIELIKSQAKVFIDAREHKYLLNEDTRKPSSSAVTARQLRESGDADAQVFTAYTGIIPIVYKAQRTLLQSLIQSIGLAFVMIAIVMMLLLRNWKERWRLSNAVNFRGGMIAMLPNVFPVIIVFGAMGHLRGFNVKVDIGSMMTASVAMGVAVDDTIHFLTWFRHGLSIGKSRNDAIRMAFDKVATAMTQTTLIAGFGLSAFAFSTFMPTQRFGVLMLVLLAVALVGDLVFLPALLAGPLGKYFGKVKKKELATTDGSLIVTGNDHAENDLVKLENGKSENGTSENGSSNLPRKGSIVPNPLLKSPSTHRPRADIDKPLD